MFQNQKMGKGGVRRINLFSNPYKDEENMDSPGFCLSLGQATTSTSVFKN